MVQQHTSPITAPKTVEELLSHVEDGRYATRLGEGDQAIAYRFKRIDGLEGIENYVIRVPKKYTFQVQVSKLVDALFKENVSDKERLEAANAINKKMGLPSYIKPLDRNTTQIGWKSFLENQITYKYKIKRGAGAQENDKFKLFLNDIQESTTHLSDSNPLKTYKAYQKYSLSEALLKSTSLTPAKQVLHHINVGNRLMNLDFDGLDDAERAENEKDPISIHLFQEGKNLFDIYQKQFEYYQSDLIATEPNVITNMRTVIYMADIIKKVTETGGFNPYIRIFKKIYALGLLGFEQDLALKNLLYYEGKNEKGKDVRTLRMVDQESRSLGNAEITETEAIKNLSVAAAKHKKEFYFSGGYGAEVSGVHEHQGIENLRTDRYKIDTDLEKKYFGARNYIRGMIDEGVKKALLPEGSERDNDGSGLRPIPRSIQFKSVKDAHGVPISNPPKALLLELQRMCENADIVR